MKQANTYKGYLDPQSEFSHQCATWAKNHMGWAKMKKTNRRVAKRRLRQAQKKEDALELRLAFQNPTVDSQALCRREKGEFLMYVWKGKEYELFEDLFTDFCNQYDICFNGCPISELCHKFEVKDIEHNAEILALMQVQEVTEQGSKLGRYLGIPVGRKFTIQGYSDTVKFCLLKDGGYETFPPNAHKSSKAIMQAIEDPSLVTPVKDYDFTKDERVFLRLLHQINPEIVLARKGNGQLYWDVPGQHMDLPQAHHILPYKMLPEILPGETVEVRYVV